MPATVCSFTHPKLEKELYWDASFTIAFHEQHHDKHDACVNFATRFTPLNLPRTINSRRNDFGIQETRHLAEAGTIDNGLMVHQNKSWQVIDRRL